MEYTQTATFRQLLAPMDAEINELRAQIDQLARTIQSITATNVGLVKSKRKPTALLEKKVETRQQRLKALQKTRGSYETGESFKLFTFRDMVCILADSEGTLWTAEEAATWPLELATHEGRGEKALRMRLGIVEGPTQDVCDLTYVSNGEVRNEEAKNWESADGSSIQTFRPGKDGKKMYGITVRNITRQHQDDVMTPEQWEALATGEVSSGKLYSELPIPVQSTLQNDLSPDKVLATYDAIYGTLSIGYIKVLRQDYDKAFRLVGITQMSPRYVLRQEYVLARLKKTLTTVQSAA